MNMDLRHFTRQTEVMRRILLLLAGVYLAHPLHALAGATLNGETLKYGFTLGKSGELPLSLSQEKKGEKMRFVSLRGESGKRIIELELSGPLEADESRAMARKKLEIIARQYEAQRTPYPGELTNVAVCKAKHRPEIRSRVVNGLNLDSLVGFASGRNSFGACDKDSIRKLGLLSYFYLSESKTLVELRAFSPYPGSTKAKLFSIVDEIGTGK